MSEDADPHVAETGRDREAVGLLPESQALGDVHARLAVRFPNVADAVIEAAVRLEHRQLDGPICDYVPVLVEHAARDRIAAFADRQQDQPPA